MINAYPILTDLHDINTKKANRFSYQKEVEYIDKVINETIDKYVDRGCDVSPLLLGDVADRSFKAIDKAIVFVQRFKLWNEKCKAIYLNIGNHEMSFYKDNPTWSLFKNIESSRMHTIVGRNYTPKGLYNEVKIVDELEDGEVVFHFNHNPLPIKTLTTDNGKINIGLFHHDLISPEIMNKMRDKYSMDIFDAGHTDFTRLSVLQYYSYAFLGHMHKAYGTFSNVDDTTSWETMVYYLGSLNRPNVSEVSNNFLERNIPVVLVEDGKFIGVENNFFNLYKREVCVKEDIVIEEKRKYEERKYIKASKELIISAEDPVENLRNNFRGTNEEYIFNSLKDKIPSIEEGEIVNDFTRLMKL